jgi:hypothetical protein
VERLLLGFPALALKASITLEVKINVASAFTAMATLNASTISSRAGTLFYGSFSMSNDTTITATARAINSLTASK